MNCYAKEPTAWERKLIERGRAHLLATWQQPPYTTGQPEDFAVRFHSIYAEPPDIMLDRYCITNSTPSMSAAWIDFARRHRMEIENDIGHGFSVFVPRSYYATLVYFPFETSMGCLCEQLSVFMLGVAIILAVYYLNPVAQDN